MEQIDDDDDDEDLTASLLRTLEQIEIAS